MKCWQAPFCEGTVVHECNSRATCRRKHFTAFSSILWLYILSVPSFGMFPQCWRGWYGWLLRAEHSAVWPVKTLNTGQLLAIIPCKGKVWPRLRAALIYVYKYTYLESSLTQFLFIKTTVGFPLGPMNSSPALGFWPELFLKSVLDLQ